MYISVLKDTILDELVDAEEIWLAAGLVTSSGLPFVEGRNAAVHILAGIDLPTPPNVLRRLLKWSDQGKIEFKVFSIDGVFFHPKVYIWRRGLQYKAYVGSGNLTNGGWNDNIELFWQIDKATDCESLVRWFEKHMTMAIYIDETFITKYEELVFKLGQKANREHHERLGKFKQPYEPDFDFFFRAEDFEAFAYERAVNDNDISKTGRKLVNRKLLGLHDRLYIEILNKDWDLHHHHRRGKIVSSFAHNARVNPVLDGMWLYYGKSEAEAIVHPIRKDDERSMNNHVRLQLIVRQENVGVWCAVGKGGGSRVDRTAFHYKIQERVMQQTFFRMIKRLGDEYFIDVAGIRPFYKISEIETADDLFDIVNQDFENMEHYFIIGMNLIPEDRRLTDNRIVAFIMEEFEKLYPIYLFFKAPVPLI
jgi:HKD family nuclease